MKVHIPPLKRDGKQNCITPVPNFGLIFNFTFVFFHILNFSTTSMIHFLHKKKPPPFSESVSKCNSSLSRTPWVLCPLLLSIPPNTLPIFQPVHSILTAIFLFSSFRFIFVIIYLIKSNVALKNSSNTCFNPSYVTTHVLWIFRTFLRNSYTAHTHTHQIRYKASHIDLKLIQIPPHTQTQNNCLLHTYTLHASFSNGKRKTKVFF